MDCVVCRRRIWEVRRFRQTERAGLQLPDTLRWPLADTDANEDYNFDVNDLFAAFKEFGFRITSAARVTCQELLSKITIRALCH
jgi:hypothetical protein